MSGEPDPGAERPADQPPGGPTEQPPGHDATGLDLARSVAAAYRRTLGAARGAARGPAGLRGRSPNRRRGTATPGPVTSGAHPDERDPQPLDAVIDRLVAQHGWRTDLAVHGVFSRWDQIVGTDVARHCRPERFADGELTVRADSTAWATQMRLLAAQVVRRLNVELGDGTVSRIQVLGPETPSWRHGWRTVRGGRGPRDTYG